MTELNDADDTTVCPACGGPLYPLQDLGVPGGIRHPFFRCRNCGLDVLGRPIEPEKPDPTKAWSDNVHLSDLPEVPTYLRFSLVQVSARRYIVVDLVSRFRRSITLPDLNAVGTFAQFRALTIPLSYNEAMKVLAYLTAFWDDKVKEVPPSLDGLFLKPPL